MRSRMSDTVLPTTAEETPADRLVSVDMDEWSPAGGPVCIDFAPERTVLVGKNASGKSISFEGIVAGAFSATYPSNLARLGPGSMCFALNLGGEAVSYSYRWSFENQDEDEDDEAISWEERCWRPKTGKEIWRVAGGVAHIAEGAQVPMPPGTGLLSLRGTPSFHIPVEADRIRKLLNGIRLVTAGVSRTQIVRMNVRLARKHPGKLSKKQSRVQYDERIYGTALRLVGWFEDRHELFEHFVALAQRLGVARRVDVKIESADATEDDGADVAAWATIAFDGVDFGLLSDGTLRIAEILLGFVDPKVSLLMLEEPETGLHPGLLHRLLAEVDSHTLDRQVILSTHSPLVVDWAKPSEIRLVERTDGKTQVYGLGSEEKESVKKYLNDDFSLSDYIYSSEAAQ
jgi:ABC-type transport system involved in cytochrome c biogenesis ATPase subunit